MFVRRDGHVPPLEPLYTGPFKVLKREEKTFTIQVGTKTEVVSVDRLKPVLSDGPVEVQLPPRRGRPRKSPVEESVAPPKRRGRPPKKR